MVPPKPPLLRLPIELLFDITALCTPADVASLVACNREINFELSDQLLHINITRYGASAVPWAAFHDRLDLLKALYCRGASVTGHWGLSTGTRDWQGRRKYLPQFDKPGLHYLSDPGRTMAKTFSPLHAAAAAGHDRVVSWLLDHGAEIDGECRRLCMCKDCRLLVGGGQLQAQGLEEEWFPSWTTLHLAYCYGRDSTATLLLERGANRHSTSSSYPGINALHTAIYAGAFDHIKMLLTPSHILSIDPNVADNRGVTAVAMAVRASHARSNEFGSMNNLNGPDRTIVREREMPSDLVTHTFTSMPQVMREGVSQIKFQKQRWSRSINHLWLLLQAGVFLEVESPAEDEFSYHHLILPLHQALLGGSFEAADLLLLAGARADGLSAGQRPIHCVFNGDHGPSHMLADTDDLGLSIHKRWEAWKTSRLCTTKKLLVAGADPNARTTVLPDERCPTFFYKQGFTLGVTPLMYACRMADSVECVRFLLQHGADSNAVDARGQNAIHWVVGALDQDEWENEWKYRFFEIGGKLPWKHCAGEIIELLMERGCDPRKLNALNQCAFGRAMCAADVLDGLNSPLFRILYDYACHHCLCSAGLDDALKFCIMNQDIDAVDWAITRGAKITEQLLMEASHSFWDDERGIGHFEHLECTQDFVSFIVKCAKKYHVRGPNLASYLLSWFPEYGWEADIPKTLLRYSTCTGHYSLYK